MSGRALIVLGSATGGLGLGLAIGYFMLVAASFLPEGHEIAAFMVGKDDGQVAFGFTLVAIPYALLLLHLWLRVRVANLLVERGELGLAREYAGRRLRVGLLRSRREALANRVALMRVALREERYADGRDIAAAAQPGSRGRGALAEFHRYRLELALRSDDLIAAREVVEQAWPMVGLTTAVAEFCACAAELAVRNNDAAELEAWRERAEFADPDAERLKVTALFAARRFAGDAARAADLARDFAAPRWLAEVPGAAAEVAAVRAMLLAEVGEVDEARRLLGSTDPGDARSQYVRAAAEEALEEGE